MLNDHWSLTTGVVVSYWWLFQLHHSRPPPSLPDAVGQRCLPSLNSLSQRIPSIACGSALVVEGTFGAALIRHGTVLCSAHREHLSSFPQPSHSSLSTCGLENEEWNSEHTKFYENVVILMEPGFQPLLWSPNQIIVGKLDDYITVFINVSINLSFIR